MKTYVPGTAIELLIVRQRELRAQALRRTADEQRAALRAPAPVEVGAEDPDPTVCGAALARRGVREFDMS